MYVCMYVCYCKTEQRERGNSLGQVLKTGSLTRWFLYTTVYRGGGGGVYKLRWEARGAWVGQRIPMGGIYYGGRQGELGLDKEFQGGGDV